MKNVQVAIDFIQGRNSNTQNLKSIDGKLYSYTSLMAEWRGGIIVIYENIATYSNTSKRHWYYLRSNVDPKKILLKDKKDGKIYK